MNKIPLTALAAALIGTITMGANAADKPMKSGMSMSKDMKAMDTNGDGMISKDEYMKHHEMMFEGMQKNKDGMVDMKHMSMMKGGAMKGHKMTKSDSMMKSDAAMKNDKMATGGSMMKTEPMMKSDMNMKSGSMMKGDAKGDAPMTKSGITTGQKAPN